MTEFLDDQEVPVRKFDFNSLLDETITADDFAELDNAIQSDPRVLLDYLAFMQVAGFVTAPKGVYASESSLTRHIRSVEQTEKKNKFYKNLYRKIAVGVICFAVVATILISLAWQDFSNHLYPRLVANIEVLKPATWKCEHSYFAGWKKTSRSYDGLNQVSVKQDDELYLTSGLFKLTLDGGAIVTIMGPAEVKALGNETLFVSTGVVSVDVSDKAKKPVIGTPQGWFKDIGTTYCLDVASDQHTDLHVLDGSVLFAINDESFKDPNTTSLVKQYQAGRVVAGNSKLATIDYNPGGYLDVCRQHFGLEEFSSNVQILANNSALDLNMGKLESNDLVYLVPEKPVVITQDCSYKTLTANVEAVNSEFAGFLTLPANQGQNQKVMSYLIHRDLVGTADGPTLTENLTSPLDAQITLKFKHPVIGVIDTVNQLEQSDAIFGWQHVNYPGTDDPGFVGRDIGAGCKLLLSEDRRTLTVFLPMRVSQAGAGKRMVDHLRILTLAE